MTQDLVSPKTDNLHTKTIISLLIVLCCVCVGFPVLNHILLSQCYGYPSLLCSSNSQAHLDLCAGKAWRNHIHPRHISVLCCWRDSFSLCPLDPPLVIIIIIIIQHPSSMRLPIGVYQPCQVMCIGYLEVFRVVESVIAERHLFLLFLSYFPFFPCSSLTFPRFPPHTPHTTHQRLDVTLWL